MEKNEQCHILCMLRDRLKRERDEAEQRYKECVAEVALIDDLLKQLSITNKSNFTPTKEYRRTMSNSSISDLYFGQPKDFDKSGITNNATVKNSIDEVSKKSAIIRNANTVSESEKHTVKEALITKVDNDDPYFGIEEFDIKDYQIFMKAYQEGTLQESSCRVLGISQNLSNFTREKWEDFEGKDEISLIDSPIGKYWAYPMDEGERRFFLVPSRMVKFNNLQCISNGFPAFFDFDMDKATGDAQRTPVVLLPAIVEKDSEGRYFRAGQGEDYPPKGRLKL